MRGLGLSFRFPLQISLIALAAWYGVGAVSGSSQALAPCALWEAPEILGTLDTAYINEASGMGLASFSNDLYLINDSGDAGRFFVTGAAGGGTAVVGIDGFDPVDVEDLAVGPCEVGGETCVFIADIGDNGARRSETEVIVIPEQAPFLRMVNPGNRIRIRYPDGPRDAESLAVHPNGDLIILTKTADYARLTVEPSVLYRVPYAQWVEARGDLQLAERIGELDFPVISSDRFAGSLPTAMDIHPDGQRFLVLTYLHAFEFYADLSVAPLKPTSEMVDGVDYQEIEIMPLEQQESIAYLESGDGFLYTTEGRSPNGVPIMGVSCQR